MSRGVVPSLSPRFLFPAAEPKKSGKIAARSTVFGAVFSVFVFLRDSLPALPDVSD